VIDTILLWVGILVVLALDLVTEATRASLLNSRSVRLVAMRAEDAEPVDKTIELLAQPTRLRASLRITLTILRALLIGLILAVSGALQSDPYPSLLWALLLAALLIWLSEFIIEWLSLVDPENWALMLSVYARALVTLWAPVLALPLALFRAKPNAERTTLVTEDELKNLVDAGQQEGVLEQDERQMIYSIFRFGDTLAREIMVPRIDVFALPVTMPTLEAVDAVLESGFSRIPVYQESIDNIVGLLYAKDLLRAWREGNHVTSFSELLRTVYYIPESKKVTDLLAEMQAQRVHMAIVVDEYGGMAGLVTLEDIVEEIIGEIQDEYDQAEELLIQQVNEREFLFHGRIDLDDFDDIMETSLAQDDSDTLGGYIYSRIGRVPKGGESLRVGDLELTVEQVLGRRIRKVRVRRLPAIAESDEEKAHADR
jgi:CBS domain containing-hemolysin-like protein